MKVVAIIQARMGSTRLPGKVMKKIKGKTVLNHVIDRVSQSKLIEEIIIATTVHDIDNLIEQEALKCGVKVYRGSENDVLSRYYYAAKVSEADTVIRVTSDCPVIDPYIIDEVVEYFINGTYDIVANAGAASSQRTFPRGLDTEIFTFSTLETAFFNAHEDYQREHVTPYIYENFEKVQYFKSAIDYSKYRWTLDTKEDFELIEEIYKNLFTGIHDFYLTDIIELFKREPKLFEINAHIEQKKI